MNIIEEAIATLGIKGSIAVVIVLVFAVLQLIGEFIEAFGKVSPPFLKIRKLIKDKLRKNKQEKQETKETLEKVKALLAEKEDTKETLEQVKTLLAEVNTHYSADNITKRNEWMTWVNKRAVVYDSKIEELVALKSAIDKIAAALDCNTKTTDEMFKESCRDRIINFASKVTNPLELVSKEEFNRVFNVYNDYEAFLKQHNEPNGQVEISYSLIKEAYAERLKTKNFIEDIHPIGINE